MQARIHTKRMPNQNASDKSYQPEALTKPRAPKGKNAFQHLQKSKTKAQSALFKPTHPPTEQQAQPNH